MRTLVFGLAAVLWLVSAACAQGGRNVDADVSELLDRLFSKDAKVRERSLAALQGYGLDVLPAIARRLLEKQATEPLGRVIQQASAAAKAAATPTAHDSDASVESYFEEQLTYARGRIKGKDFDGALKWLDAILTLAPDGAVRAQAGELRRQTRNELTRESVVRGEVVTAGSRFGLNELVEVQLRLTNASDSTLTIPHAVKSSGQEAETIIIATIVYRMYDPTGNVLSTTETRRIAVEEDIQMSAGGAWTTSFVINLGEQQPSSPTVRTYSISAQLRPVEVRMPMQSLYRRIDFPAHTITVFPVGWERVAVDPLSYLSDCLAKRSRHELAITSWLIPRGARAAAVDTLVAALVTVDDQMATVVMGCLARLTGRESNLDAASWTHWWTNAQADWEPPSGPDDDDAEAGR